MKQQLEQLRPLLQAEEHWDQAIELLISLDDPALWKAVLDTMDARHLDRRIVGLLARMPDDAPGVREKRASYRTVQLNSNSLLDGTLTPNIERISFVRTSFAAGSASPTWFHQFRRLKRLKMLELNGAEPDVTMLELEQLEHLRLTQCRLERLPNLPALTRLEMRGVRGICAVGTSPCLRSVTIQKCPPFGEGHTLLPFMARTLREIRLVYSGIRTLDFLAHAIGRDAPLERVDLEMVRGLVSIDGLRNAQQLRRLSIVEAPLDEIEVIATLPRLASLSLQRTKVRSLEPLGALGELRELDLTGCEWIRSLEPLRLLPKLERLVLRETPFTARNVPPELRDFAVWPNASN